MLNIGMRTQRLFAKKCNPAENVSLKPPHAPLQAAANAKENKGLRKLKLYVSECYCDQGMILKRIKTRAKGRYATQTCSMQNNFVLSPC